jgi:hypothetical protein
LRIGHAVSAAGDRASCTLATNRLRRWLPRRSRCGRWPNIAFSLGSELTLFMQSIVKVSNGYPMQSLGFLETAHSLNHIESEIIRFLGRMYLYTGRDEDALEFINKNLRIDISNI